MSDMPPIEFLKTSDGEKIAYRSSPAKPGQPSFIWCGGLRSDMEGGKAIHLHNWALENGYGYLRFDYFGHGESSGDFEMGTIGRWAEDTIYVMDKLTHGPLILVGSSMGGWAALLGALARPQRVEALLLIAPAPDFTQKLMWAGFSEDIRTQILTEGVYYEPSEYGYPMPISRVLIEGGKAHLLLDGPIDFSGPVRILQGMKDASVPYSHASKIVKALVSDDVDLTLVKDGDHRLSEPQDLARLSLTAQALVETLSGFTDGAAG